MGAAIATAFVEIRPDTKKGQAETKAQVQKMAEDATKTFAKFFVATAVVNELGKATQAAARLEQAVGGTEAVFGEFQSTVDEAAQSSAKSMGISEAAFREVTSQIGGLLSGFGFTQEEAAKTSVSLTQLGADLAATFGGKPEEAVQALGAALRGEFDPLERFGVSLNAAKINLKAVEMGLAPTTTQVDANAKAQAALALITEQSGAAQGQFAREADTASGKTAIMTASLEDARAKLGTQLLPIFSQAVGFLTLLVDGFSALPGPVQATIVAIAALAALASPIKTLVTTIGDISKAMVAFGKANPYVLAAAAAVLAVVSAVQFLESDAEKTAKRVDTLAESMRNAGDAGKGLSAALQFLVEDNQLLADLFDHNKLTIDDASKAALGGAEAWDEFTRALIDDIAVMESSAGQREALRLWIENFPSDAAAAQAQMEQLDRITGQTGDSMAGLAVAGGDASEELKGVKLEALDTGTAMDVLNDASSKLKKAFDDIIGVGLDLDASFDALVAAGDELNKTLFENGVTLDSSTEAGRANREAVRSQVDALLDYGAELVRTGSSNEEAANAVNFLRQSLIDQMTQAGFTQEQVEDYLTTLGLTPDNVTTSIEAAGVEAQKERINDWIDRLGEIPAEKASEIQALIAKGDLDAAEAALENLTRTRNMRIVATVSGNGSFQVNYGNGVVRSAAGRYAGSPMVSTLAEEGPEAVLPLDKPSRLAELLADERIGGPVRNALGMGGRAGGSSSSISIGAIYTQQPRGVRDELEYLAWKGGAK
jgi:hypothetical protein